MGTAFTDKEHALYTVLDANEGGTTGRVRLLVWDKFMARQRYQPGQVRPHWKVYQRGTGAESRELLTQQVEAFVTAGFKMTVKPVLVRVTDDVESEFNKTSPTVAYPFRGVLDKVDKDRAVPFAEALEG
jgi:hypothetical protein